MKNKFLLLPFILLASTAMGCLGISGVNLGRDSITPSDVIVTEERAVSGFTGIDMRTFGQVLLSQGESESLSIEGSDNLVPLIETSVRNGVLVIELESEINLLDADLEDVLTFRIALKDLNEITVGGLAEVRMETLSTSELSVDMSGAGQIRLEQLAAESVDIHVDGLGSVEIAGEVSEATIDISGAGVVSAADLECRNAEVRVPGLGSATVWVTDQLTGSISGGGSVSYYGDPQTDLETTGLGEFKSMGNK